MATLINRDFNIYTDVRFAKGNSAIVFGAGWQTLRSGFDGLTFSFRGLLWIAQPEMTLFLGNAVDGSVLEFPGAVTPVIFSEVLDSKSVYGDWFTDGNELAFQVTGSPTNDRWFFRIKSKLSI